MCETLAMQNLGKEQCDAGYKRVCVFMQVYRNESSMHKAIRSVLNQTCRNIRFCILVGPDTRQDVQEYAKMDSRIEVYEGRPGESNFDYYTRWKELLKKGREPYFTVLDADDWYDSCYIEELLQYAEKNNTDISACGNYFVNASGVQVGVRQQMDMVWNMQDTPQALPYMYAFFRTIWGKLIRSNQILNQKMEEIPERKEYGGYGGDTLYMFNLLPGAKRLGICKKVLYYYRLSETGSSYVLREGRLNSDAFLFHYVRNTLLKLGPVGEMQDRFLYQVYGNALKDTTSLLKNQNMTPEEETEKLLYIYGNDLTGSLLRRERSKQFSRSAQDTTSFTGEFYELIFQNVKHRTLSSVALKNYLTLFEMICSQWSGMLSPQEFSILLTKKELLDSLVAREFDKLFTLLLEQLKKIKSDDIEACLQLIRRIAKADVLKPALTEQKFVLRYSNLLDKINRQENQEAFDILKELFAGPRAPYRADVLIELWSNLAASLENAGEFVFSKECRIEVLLQTGQIEAARLCYNELADIGICDEKMAQLHARMRE